MIRYYLKTALKIIKRHTGFTALNVTGLTLGISSCLLIILYINFELGFDRFHDNEANIYRVVMHQPGNKVVGSSSDWWVVSPYILKPTWENELPGIDIITRTREQYWSFSHNDQFINEEIMVVDPEFFKVFTFPLSSGNEKEVFTHPYSIVISRNMAAKYFGEDDPIGKTIVKNDGKIFSVTGLLEDVPENSHLKFDFLVSFQTLELIRGESLLSDNWLNNGYRTYVVLNENANLREFDAKLKKYDIDGFNGKTWSFHLQPLQDIHFNRLIGGTGDKGSLFIFVSVGFFIVFIAGFNYMNLYVAHYRTRTKNIGVRRISGATRMQLMFQFLCESLLLIAISTLASIGVVWLVLPVFNNFIGEQLSFAALLNYQVVLGSGAAVLLMALIAGTYPAIYLSGLQIVSGIQGTMEKFSKRAILFRKTVIVIQFSVSIVLLVGTITVYRQLNFAGNKSLGYETQHILYLELDGMWYKDNNGVWRNRSETLKQELLKNASIVKAAGSTGVPTRIGWSNIPIWEGQVEGDNPFFYRLNVDEDFLGLYGIEIVDGRGFSAEAPGDLGNAYVLNEAAVKDLGFEHPVGAHFGFDKKLGSVVGVARDFHFESLHKPVTPIGIGFTNNGNYNYLSLKINSENIPATIRYIGNVWNNLAQNVALKYSFLDEQLNLLYQKDRQLAESLNYFSLMALVISCLGIFGLMSFAIKERTKELGIRKVLGAPFMNLLNLLSRDILIIIALASGAGGILGWYAADQWLNNFAYRIDIGLDTIIISSVITLLMAILPVSVKLMKAVKTNPVESLRTD
jgi:putative ABC transport system permease protein